MSLTSRFQHRMSSITPPQQCRATTNAQTLDINVSSPRAYAHVKSCEQQLMKELKMEKYQRKTYSEGGYLPHRHTPEGYIVTLEDPDACRCSGFTFQEHIHRVNSMPFQATEMVDVPLDVFEDAPNDVQAVSLEDYVVHAIKKMGLTGEQVESKIDEVVRMFLHAIDTIAISVRFLKRAETWQDYYFVFLNAFKLITGKNSSDLVDQLFIAEDWLINYVAESMGYEAPTNKVQGFTENLGKVRAGLEAFKKVKSCQVLKNATRLLKYCLSFGFFTKFGLTFDNLHYSETEAAYVKQKFSDKQSFLEELVEGVLFFLERGAQAVALKSWAPFLYNSASFGKWTEKAFEIKNHYKMLEANNNPEITYSSVLGELNEAIKTGELMDKIPSMDSTAKAVAKKLLLDLKFIYCELTATERNQKMRTPPFAELVCGNSSVGKTLFTDLLALHYARVNKLPEGTEFIYHRNPGEEHWNGFKPHMHTIVYDDAGASNPKKMQGIDPSLGELLPVINPNAMGANMADLESKGHSPVRPEHVIVNTNTEDLHADVYYAFPLALRRRLPYVITVSPRVDPENGIDYRQAQSPSMLDTSALPELMPGEYPNQWNIHVKHVIAKQGNGDQPPQVAFNDEHIFVDIYEFLWWYNQVIEEHKRMSVKMMRTQHSMRDAVGRVSWCEHNLPRPNCRECKNKPWAFVQGPLGDESDDEFHDAFEYVDLDRAEEFMAHDFDIIFDEAEQSSYFSLLHDGTYAMIYYVDSWIQKIQAGVATIADIGCQKVKEIVISKIKEEAITCLKSAGQTIWDTICAFSPLKWVLIVLPILASAAYLFSWMTDSSEDDPIQGPATSKYGKPMEVENPDAEANPWYNADMKVSSFDVPVMAMSWKGKTEDEVRKLLSPNIVAFSLKGSKEGTKLWEFPELHALCLGGHLYVTNNHLIPIAQEYFFHIVHGTDEKGVNINKDETLGASNFYRVVDRDLVFFELHIPPRQDLRSMLAKPNLPIRCEGCYFKRDIAGFVSQNHIRAVSGTARVHPCISQEPLPMWVGQADEKTVNGDCGSVMIGMTSVGPILMGLHVGGGVTNEVESIALDTLIVEEAQKFFSTPMISCNTVNLASKDKLGPLHQKSIFRFMEGHARVYGSLPTRSTMRSKVQPTVLARALEQRGWISKHGPPVMRGWQPWNHAIGPVLQHTGKIRNDILRQAGDAYLQDIFSKVPSEEIGKLQILDDMEAINGVPGVKYLEGLNRSSSLGYPWQKSKKFMLVGLEDDRWQDGVTFKPEVWEEIDRMMKEYEQGRVANPIFVGQLKDEAIEHRKIIIGKTRVFLISSAAWTLIMRKWFLSFIRLFQRYRFTFEGMPGLRTQSGAWGKLYHHLTQFGTDRLFAGDFAKYDKVMESTTSLESFRVVYKICERAGWDQLSLNILWSIAEDAAYPTVLVNGDLVQLEGSNPSGQAVTVILNCIANSLYMRYVYILRNPRHEAFSFQENVKLITYGDDNAGAVHPHISWFNHTAIQEELAKVGIEYTMADKTSVSREFISIEEVEFLKRTWRYEPEVGDYFAPLNEESIKKRLMTGVQSSELTPEWQAVENMATSMEDYFFYGREVFEEKKAFLLSVGLESGLEWHMATQKWPQFDDLLQRWKEASDEVSAE